MELIERDIINVIAAIIAVVDTEVDSVYFTVTKHGQNHMKRTVMTVTRHSLQSAYRVRTECVQREYGVNPEIQYQSEQSQNVMIYSDNIQ